MALTRSDKGKKTKPTKTTGKSKINGHVVLRSQTRNDKDSVEKKATTRAKETAEKRPKELSAKTTTRTQGKVGGMTRNLRAQIIKHTKVVGTISKVQDTRQTA